MLKAAFKNYFANYDKKLQKNLMKRCFIEPINHLFVEYKYLFQIQNSNKLNQNFISKINSVLLLIFDNQNSQLNLNDYQRN